MLILHRMLNFNTIRLRDVSLYDCAAFLAVHNPHLSSPFHPARWSSPFRHSVVSSDFYPLLFPYDSVLWSPPPLPFFCSLTTMDLCFIFSFLCFSRSCLVLMIVILASHSHHRQTTPVLPLTSHSYPHPPTILSTYPALDLPTPPSSSPSPSTSASLSLQHRSYREHPLLLEPALDQKALHSTV